MSKLTVRLKKLSNRMETTKVRAPILSMENPKVSCYRQRVVEKPVQKVSWWKFNLVPFFYKTLSVNVLRCRIRKKNGYLRGEEVKSGIGKGPT